MQFFNNLIVLSLEQTILVPCGICRWRTVILFIHQVSWPMSPLSPLSGKIIKLNTESGASVKEGDEILLIESMKMETPIFAPCTGIVSSINVKEGDNLEDDDLIAIFE